MIHNRCTNDRGRNDLTCELTNVYAEKFPYFHQGRVDKKEWERKSSTKTIKTF